MNMKGLLVATIGVFVIYVAVKGTYKDVWKALSNAGKGASNGG